MHRNVILILFGFRRGSKRGTLFCSRLYTEICLLDLHLAPMHLAPAPAPRALCIDFIASAWTTQDPGSRCNSAKDQPFNG